MRQRGGLQRVDPDLSGMTSTAKQNPQASNDNDQLGIYLFAAVPLGLVLWLVPALAGLVWAQSLPNMGAVEQMFGTLGIVTDGHLGDPRAAYPVTARDGLPPGLWFYPVAAVLFAPLVLLVALQWRRVDRLRARARLDRHELDPRGSSPTDWARPRHVPELVGHPRGEGRFSLGRLKGRDLSSDPESQIVVVAPPRAGKTTRLVVPWLLEHDGPAIVTTTKSDIAAVCSRWRGQLGDVLIWDPFDPNGSACWTPLDGCEDWAFAISQADWLAQAAKSGPGEDRGSSHFWDQEATTLLAPVLHAAALAGLGMDTVLTWLRRQDENGPLDILRSDGATAAADELSAVLGVDPRSRSYYYISCKNLLRAYRSPNVLATTKSGLTPADFLDGGAHTLLLTAAKEHQDMLAPIIAAMISSLLQQQKAKVRARGLDGPLLRVVLDECAQMARLNNLHGEVAEAGGQNIRFALVYQTIAQIYDRHGPEAAQAMLGAATTRLYMGPITDNRTRQDVTALLGDRHDHHGPPRPLANTQELIQLDEGRAILLAGANPPAIVALDRYWEQKDLAPRADRPAR